MKNMPLVTIVTPSYNQGKFIEETIKSILNQSYKNIEYIIVDGGSTDNTMDVIDKYRDRIDIIIHEKDKGQADAINKGFKLAKGELIGWINSDDILYANCVEKIVDLYMNSPEGAIYHCSIIDWIDEKGNFLIKRKIDIPNRNYLLNHNYTIIQQGSFYLNKYVKKINYLDESLFYCMDLDLWLRLLKHGNIYKLNDQSYSAFRFYNGTKTEMGKNKFLKNIKEVLLKHEAKWYSKNILRCNYYALKLFIKNIIYGQFA